MQLTQSGALDRLKKVLREKLEECGWRDEIRAHCRGRLSTHAAQFAVHKPCCVLCVTTAIAAHQFWCRAAVLKEQPDLTQEQLVAKVKPKGRAAVPDSVKADLLARLRTQITA